RPDRHDLDRHLATLLDEAKVTGGGGGEVVEATATGKIVAPAGEGLVDRRQGADVGGKGGERRFTLPIARADADFVEAGEDVELRHRERIEAVDAHRVPEGDQIEPARPTGPTGHRAE